MSPVVGTIADFVAKVLTHGLGTPACVQGLGLGDLKAQRRRSASRGARVCKGMVFVESFGNRREERARGVRTELVNQSPPTVDMAR
jgi:hypothetical protein